MKSETGVHRLVRISPFDANKRRHTSFASVFIYPETDEDINIEINPDDLKTDTFRASGAGGQHVNKTSSREDYACADRNSGTMSKRKISAQKPGIGSQSAEGATLSAALEEERAKLANIEASKKKIEWGSQIRSYVFQPYTLVKDHRTNYESSNVNAVMDGDIDNFIQAYLAYREEG